MASRTIFEGGDPLLPRLWVDDGSGKLAPTVALQGAGGSGATGAIGTLANPLSTQARAVRSTGTLHRSAITAIDRLAVPASPTVADVATGGTLNFNTTYNVTAAASNTYGATTVPTVGAVTTANDASATHVARVTLAAVTRAVTYDLFLSTAANPLWVARITEAQRAAGCTVTAVGTVTGTSPGAGKIDIQVVGTGLASNVAPFTVNNAYDISTITPINCAGYSTARVYVLLTVTDLRSLPTLATCVFDSSSGNLGIYARGATSTFALLTGANNVPMLRQTDVTVAGTSQFIVAIDTLTGQGASVDVWVDLF